MRRVGRLAIWDQPEGRGGIPALDGLRAVAVALVLVGHGGIPGVGGGFIGVDIFFVLSGFLITSLLLDELGRSGRIELTGFWIRRARRLLPALVLMVLAVGVGTRTASARGPYRVTKRRARRILVGGELAVRRAARPTTSPRALRRRRLQHTWSLGVEEQYYLIWPLLLIAVALLLAAWPGASHRDHNRRGSVGCVRAGRRGRARLRRHGHHAGIRRLARPRVLRHRHPRTGAAGRRRCVCSLGPRLVLVGGRLVFDPVAVGQMARQGLAGYRPGGVGSGRSLRHRPRRCSFTRVS